MDRITNYKHQGTGDMQKLGQCLLDPTWPSSTLATFADQRLCEIEGDAYLEDVEANKRKVVSVRLSVQDIYYLDEIAKKLADTRSGMATTILEIGIEELRAKLGIPRLFSTRIEADEQTTTLKNGETGELLGSFQDDAIQIGGGDR